MPTYNIRGINVDFPFEAYECQLVYMEKVIQALQTGCNALLESPTGTGKTLCLLCATLAWRKSLGEFSTGKRYQRRVRSDRKSEDEDPGSQSGGEEEVVGTGFPTIIYTSRTHSQLRQVVQELKRSNYRPKMMILGSREQLCIHKDVSLLRGKAQNHACVSLRKKREQSRHRCSHFSRVTGWLTIADYLQCMGGAGNQYSFVLYDNYFNHLTCLNVSDTTVDHLTCNPHLGDEPVDIEDLVNIGKTQGPCPYYISRELHKVVDILFAPYNYLIDRGNRKSLKIDWQNSILIFDEAHNLESLCADAASFDLPAGLLTACIAEAKSCIDLCVVRRAASNDKSLNPDNFAILRALLLKLEKRIAEVPIESRELGFTKPGPYIYELLADLNITRETSSKIINIIEEAAALLEEDKQKKANETMCRLESIGDILKIVFGEGGSSHAHYYRVHVQENAANATDIVKGKPSRTLSWWCFNPGVAMQEFSQMGVGSIILTSGTLSPMDSFAQELKLNFPIRLENPHVISSDQIWAGVVSAGPSSRSFNSSYRNRDSLEYKQELGNAIDQIWAGVVSAGPSSRSFNSSYRNRDSLEYKQELGNAIVNFARIVPDGLLVFFPSYYLLDQCIQCWKNMGQTSSATIWERICKHKKPVVEPRQSSLFPVAIEDYMAKLKDNSTSGAIFFAVCRGKVSEGLDFADHAGRAVVITGMPFAMRHDPKVRLKREFLDEQMRSRRDGREVHILTGEDWYTQQASRAVNQAVGRVIRHRHDYGAIIFCDERFSHSNLQSQISRWIRPHINCHTKFGDVVFTLSRFFRDVGIHIPTKLELTQSKGTGNTCETSISQPEGKFDQDNFLTSGTPKEWDCTGKSLSSFLEANRGKDRNHFEEVLPANRSSLTPFKELRDLKLKYASKVSSIEKKVIMPGAQNPRGQKHEIIDLTDQSSLDETPSKTETLVSCSSKKLKIFHTQHSNTSEDASGVERLQSDDRFSFRGSAKLEKSPICLDRSKPNDQVSSSLSHKHITQKGGTEFVSQKSGMQSSCSPSSNDESRGSAFLIQVKEKLTSAEYKEFVGFMKALKSKAMKISHVLESIAKIFSGPERFPLLKRFKDFVPAKYHSLYDHYVQAGCEALDTQTNLVE
ncbi:hypothetical protein Tsubulata_047102 [Turnera subulata]|uniref:Regulator of telomere elongation helicase 1 homolog n=1 Tax=Turnera subulata TaxID=218843 RepID=A0A9Q0G5J5_9ROSI|nr:hypothetical protein Tsubulata_047102 [Turnera subulata]